MREGKCSLAGHTKGSPAWWEAMKLGLGGVVYEIDQGHMVMTALAAPVRLGAKRGAFPAVIDIRVNFTDGSAHYPEWWGPTGWSSLDGALGWKIRTMAQRAREVNSRVQYGAMECDV